jgi:hypothetical protein
VLLPHCARIVYEGSIAVESPNPHLGVPEFANGLDHSHDGPIARSRHGGKFLDDNKKTFADLQGDMLVYYAAHQDEFLGNTVPFARFLESDISIISGAGNRVVGSSITSHFRSGIESSIDLESSGPLFFALARSQGGVLAWLSAFDGISTPNVATIDYSTVGGITGTDERVVRYLRDRYDPSFDVATKLIVLMVEGELNTCLSVMAAGEARHAESIFRARVVGVYHSLRAVEGVLDANPSATSTRTQNIRTMLAHPSTRRLLDEPALRRIRNRCMHYEIRDTALPLDPALPMFGIVEALSSGDSFAGVHEEVVEVAARLAAAIHDW